MTNLSGTSDGHTPSPSQSEATEPIEDAKFVPFSQDSMMSNGWHTEELNNFQPKRKKANKRKLSMDSLDSSMSVEALKKRSKLAKTLLEEGKHGVIDGRWVCGECGKSLSSASGLDQHLTTVHGEYSFACEFCPLKFKRKDHVKNHTRRVHECLKTCSKCNKQFIGREKYADHMKAVHKIKLTFRAIRNHNKPQVSKIESSPKKLEKEKEVKLTRRGKRLGRPPKSPEKSPEVENKKAIMPPPTSTPVKQLGHECKFCQRRFHNEAKLHFHKMNHHRDEMTFQFCSLCRRYFSGVSCLQNHKEVHHYSKNMIKCSFCSGAFHEQVSLEDHLRFFHLEEECLLCGSVFTGAFEMYEHISDDHTPLKNEFGHQCIHCGALFPHRHHAIDHFLRRHVYHWNFVALPRQIFACPHCQSPFDSWTKLDQHVLSEHGSYGFYYLEPDYVAISCNDTVDELILLPCAVCNEYYHDQVSLDKHIINDHEPYATRRRPFNLSNVTFDIPNIEYAKIVEKKRVRRVSSISSISSPPSKPSKPTKPLKPSKPLKVEKRPVTPEAPVKKAKVKRIIIPKKRTLKKRALIEERRKKRLQKEGNNEEIVEVKSKATKKNQDDNSKIDKSNILSSRTRHGRLPSRQLPQRRPSGNAKKKQRKVSKVSPRKSKESSEEEESENEEKEDERPLSRLRNTRKTSQVEVKQPPQPPKRRYLIKDDPNIFEDSDEEIMPTPKKRGDPNPKKKEEISSEESEEDESENDEVKEVEKEEEEEEKEQENKVEVGEENEAEEEENEAEEEENEAEEEENEAEEEENESEEEEDEAEEEENELEEEEESSENEEDDYDELLLMTPKVSLRSMRRSVIRRYSRDTRPNVDEVHEKVNGSQNGNQNNETNGNHVVINGHCDVEEKTKIEQESSKIEEKAKIEEKEEIGKEVQKIEEKTHITEGNTKKAEEILKAIEEKATIVDVSNILRKDVNNEKVMKVVSNGDVNTDESSSVENNEEDNNGHNDPLALPAHPHEHSEDHCQKV